MYSWPAGKAFAFTIIDDTDFSTIENVKPIYDLLALRGLRTTKTVWVYASRNKISGESLQDQPYVKFVQELKMKGFELAMHGAGSGKFTRNEILEAYEFFKATFGDYPKMHINHSGNQDNLYWGYKRYGLLWRGLIYCLFRTSRRFQGDEKNSEFYWADFALKNIVYIRDKVFNGINTLRHDPKMPYRRRDRQMSNFWFSASDGHTVEEFNDLLAPENIDRLRKEGGLCVVFTHFACGFVDAQGLVDARFEKNLKYLASQNGWFAPASEILDHLRAKKKTPEQPVSSVYAHLIDLKWIFHRVIKKIKYKR